MKENLDTIKMTLHGLHDWTMTMTIRSMIKTILQGFFMRIKTILHGFFRRIKPHSKLGSTTRDLMQMQMTNMQMQRKN